MNTKLQAVINDVKQHISAGRHDAAWNVLVVKGEEVPTEAETCLLGILALQKMGRLEAALARAAAWNKYREANIHILRAAGLLSHLLGQKNEALKYLTQAEQLKHDPQIEAKIAEIKGNNLATKKIAARLKLPSIFCDWSEMAGLFLFFLHSAIFIIFFILPYRDGFAQHPALLVIEKATVWVTSIELATHVWLTIALVGLTVIVGMVLHKRLLKQNVDTVVFSETRRWWTFHWHWGFLFMAVAASLYSNTDNVNIPFNLQKVIAAILGLVAFVAAIMVLYIFLPGARSHVEVVRTHTNKSNRVIVTQGVVMKSVKTLLPQDIASAQARISPWWLITFNSNVDVLLTNGKKLDLVAPSSFERSRRLPTLINSAMQDAKTFLANNHHDWSGIVMARYSCELSVLFG